MAKRGSGEGEGGEWGGEKDERQFRPIHNVMSAYNIPNLLHQAEEPELTFLPEEEVIPVSGAHQPSSSTAATTTTTTTTTTAAAEYLSKEVARIHSTPVDKTRNLQHFLASLPPLPVVLGSSTDDGIGENIPTSNSGSAYSSPMYTPPEEESIHMHMARNRLEREEEDGGAEVSEPDGVPTPGTDSMLGSSGERSIGPVAVGMGEDFGSQNTSSEAAPLWQSSPKCSPPPGPPLPQHEACLSKVARQQQLRQEAGGGVAGGVINFPITHSHRSHSLPHALGEFIIRGDGSVTAKKPSSVSPTTSRSALCSMARRSPAVPESEEEDGEGDRRGRKRERHTPSGPVPSAEGPEVLAEAEASSAKRWAQLHSDSQPTEDMTPRTRERFMHHRRTKSDSHHDVSGPIKTAQIFSVPERVKEIEEKAGLQAAQSLQGINQTDCQPCPPPPPDGHLSVTSSSTSRSSSEECLAPSLTSTATDRDNSSCAHVPSSKKSGNSLARHASLSPKPSSSTHVTSSSSAAHLPVQTSLSLPTSPDLESTAATTSSCPHPSPDDLVTSLHGVVKAKIQDIEGKKVTTEKTATGSTTAQSEAAAGTPCDTVTKRVSLATGQRPMSEIIFHSPYVGVVEMTDPSDSESQGSSSASSTTRTDRAGASRAGASQNQASAATTTSSSDSNNPTQQRWMGRRSTTCDVYSGNSSSSRDDSRVHIGAVFNAWAGILNTDDLQADDLASVLDLRQMFERNTPVQRLEQQSSLRRSCSLRDTRLSSPPVRLGGSARWKKCSSNANLGDRRQQRAYASASPTHGSRQSLASSVKI